MIFCLERAHECLGACPVVPGPPPWAPWGASLGGVPAQSVKVNPCPALLVFASKFISILMSILGRFGVDLGPLLGNIFGHVGAFFGPSWSQNRLQTDLSSKKLLFTKQCAFQSFLAKIDPKMGPRSTQDRPKTGPRSSWVAFFVS